MALPDFRDVERAAARLKGIARETPIQTSRHLDARSHATVFLKCENFQRVDVIISGGNVDLSRYFDGLPGS